MASSPAEQWDDLRDYATGLFEGRDAVGGVIGIVADGETHSAGFGVTNLEHPLDVTTDTLFQIGSITKTITATVILSLVELGKLDLDLALECCCALSEDIQDQAVTVQDTRLQQILEIALLTRAQRLVHQDQLGTTRFYPLAQLLGFARTDEQLWRGPVASCLDLVHDFSPSGCGQRFKFLDLVFVA